MLSKSLHYYVRNRIFQREKEVSAWFINNELVSRKENDESICNSLKRIFASSTRNGFLISTYICNNFEQIFPSSTNGRSKLVDYSRRSESVNFRKNSEIDDIFLRKQRIVDFQIYFKDSLCPEQLTNLSAKGAKRSVQMWTTSFYESFFQKYFVVHEWSAVKNSIST